MTESKIETTSELTGIGSVFDVPGVLWWLSRIYVFMSFFSPLFFFLFFLLMVSLHLGHELVREVLEGRERIQ